MDYTVNVLTETLGRQVIKILYDGLNTEIASRTTAWTTADNAYYASIGRANPGFTVETIDSDNFYPGIVPSLINAEIDKYPNCCAYSAQALPTNSRDDTGELYSVQVIIEIMVKSVNSELEVNSRMSKTLEAAHAVMMGNRSINHVVPKVGAPRITRGDVFVRRETQGSGTRWFWQGGSLVYSIDKYTYIG